jgi:hydroxymethylpyrimidine/phosphomethylpyrimidine kinase
MVEQPFSSTPRVLTIAGSDSSGGAGIEADLKTFTALGVYGMAAVTSVTVQNTLGVTAIHDLPPSLVAAQIDAVVSDIGVDAAKTGMLSNAGIIGAVVDRVAANRVPKLVVDPVMVSKGGVALLRESAREVFCTGLLPMTFLITPNLPEAETLSGMAIAGPEDVRRAAERIHARGPQYVLVKGGHFNADLATDWLYDGNGFREFTAERIPTRNTHGTGCTYSAAIAAYLAKGLAVADAVARAKDYVTGAIRHGFSLGHGPGSLNHFWNL